jgi:hypothetical protein
MAPDSTTQVPCPALSRGRARGPRDGRAGPYLVTTKVGAVAEIVSP